MSETIGSLRRFEEFLGELDLEGYRERYGDIKIVELDLPKEIQASAAIYERYWEKHDCDFPEFGEFYNSSYLPPIKVKLDAFRKKAQFSSESFYRGLPARIYRTWESLLAQVQGAYVAETIHGEGSVTMRVSQVHKGRDLVIDVLGFGKCAVKLKKVIKMKGNHHRMRVSNGVQPIDLHYEAPPDRFKMDGTERLGYTRWKEKWGNTLKVLDNGFVVFLPPMFEAKNLLASIEEGNEKT